MESQILKAKKASLLYLLLYNVQECGEYRKDREEVITEALGKIEYPSNPIFDNDGYPMVEWPEGFDDEKFIGNPDFIRSQTIQVLPGEEPQFLRQDVDEWVSSFMGAKEEWTPNNLFRTMEPILPYEYQETEH